MKLKIYKTNSMILKIKNYKEIKNITKQKKI